MSDGFFGRLKGAWNRLRGGGADAPYRALETRRDRIEFLGEPGGDALDILKGALANILEQEGNARKAYLSRVQYAGEEQVRLGLVIDGRAPAEQMAGPIAQGCREILPIDLFFYNGMPPSLIAQVESTLKPFYVAGKAVG